MKIISRWLALSVFSLLALLAAGCGSDSVTVDEPTGDSTGADATGDDSGQAAVTEADPTPTSSPAAEGLRFLLPERPTLTGEVDESTAGLPVNPIDPARITGDVFVWCSAWELPDGTLAEGTSGVYVRAGDVFTSFDGAGWLLFFDGASVTPGEPVPFRADPVELVFFLVSTIDDGTDSAQSTMEFASDQQVSSGSITFDAVPCQGDGDELSFTIDAMIGSELNFGYDAWAGVTGSFTAMATDEPQ